uniref:Uncharacterized protein n=1 Tax=Leersia perrieri TaxID=77586 RepID=A0A0D9W4X2_9ORYZ
MLAIPEFVQKGDRQTDNKLDHTTTFSITLLVLNSIDMPLVIDTDTAPPYSGFAVKFSANDGDFNPNGEQQSMAVNAYQQNVQKAVISEEGKRAGAKEDNHGDGDAPARLRQRHLMENEKYVVESWRLRSGWWH